MERLRVCGGRVHIEHAGVLRRVSRMVIALPPPLRWMKKVGLSGHLAPSETMVAEEFRIKLNSIFRPRETGDCASAKHLWQRLRLAVRLVRCRPHPPRPRSSLKSRTPLTFTSPYLLIHPPPPPLHDGPGLQGCGHGPASLSVSHPTLPLTPPHTHTRERRAWPPRSWSRTSFGASATRPRRRRRCGRRRWWSGSRRRRRWTPSPSTSRCGLAHVCFSRGLGVRFVG